MKLRSIYENKDQIKNFIEKVENLVKNVSIGFVMGIMFFRAKNVDPFYISIENQVFEYTVIKGLP